MVKINDNSQLKADSSLEVGPVDRRGSTGGLKVKLNSIPIDVIMITMIIRIIYHIKIKLDPFQMSSTNTKVLLNHLPR